ncbi:MAG: sigma-70 family RNA polymerase sigma factor [Planctomycetes bacterium]|nr:sigma-70 family RNA polymerase sigma factor [Planctomycetota bacterium]
MGSAQLTGFLRHLHSLTNPEGSSEPPDAELLGRFVARRDEPAFTLLVRRHGPMVLGVCRRVLGNEHDVEDAFQATFLTLARKAGSISNRASLGGWLHAVARRTAIRARAAAALRRRHEQAVRESRPEDFITAVAWRELQPLLDEEVGRLPERYRLPFLLCYLEGQTYRAAARHLNCPVATVSRRLAQARALLRQRLIRRGLTLPTGVLALALAQHAAPAALPRPMVSRAVRVSLSAAPGRVAGLVDVKGVHAGVGWRAAALGLLLTLSALGAGLAAVAYPACSPDDKKPPERTSSSPDRKTGPSSGAEEKTGPRAGTDVVVSGRVLGSGDRPLVGADVVLIGQPTYRPGTWIGSPAAEVLARGRANDQGQFRLSGPRGQGRGYYGLAVLASGRGHGLGGQALNPASRRQETTVRLGREVVLRGRVITLEGVGVEGAKLRITRLDQGGQKVDGLTLREPAAATSLWPAPLTTDNQGRFTLRGLGPGLRVTLEVHDDRFARQRLSLDTSAAKADAPPFALAPARVLLGEVTGQDSGRPIAGARVVADTGVDEGYVGVEIVSGVTDRRGRFRLIPYPRRAVTLTIYGPEGEPYLPFRKRVVWGVTTIKEEVKATLPRGVLVRGTVTEAASGTAVAGAVVTYRPRADNKAALASLAQTALARETVVLSEPDGSFRLPVLPGPGHVLLKGPTGDFVQVETTAGELDSGKPGSTRYYPDALAALDLKPGTGPHDVKVTLRRGVTVRGQVVKPDGKPAGKGVVVCRTFTYGGITFYESRMEFRDGQFELKGLDPTKTYPVFFLDGDNGLGAVVEVSGGAPARAGRAGKPVTVLLAPCGSATTRLIDQAGRPFAEHRQLSARPVMYLTLIVTPGAAPAQREEVQADSIRVLNMVSYFHVRTDAQGRITFPLLIPGATYRLLASEGTKGFCNKLEIRVEPGQSLKLPDVVIERPQ